MKKIILTALGTIIILITNGQNYIGNVYLTNVANDNVGNLFIQAKNINQGINIQMAQLSNNKPEMIQQLASNTDQQRRQRNNNVNVANNPINEREQLQKITPIRASIENENQSIPILLVNFGNGIHTDNISQQKIALPQIALPKIEFNNSKSPKIKTVSASKSKKQKSHSKKHSKNFGKKLKRFVKDTGIKNVKPNYELCFKF